MASPMKAELVTRTRKWGKHYYCYDVLFDGEMVVENSVDPEHDLARALLAKGLKGSVEIHCDGQHRTTVHIEAAAKRSTVDGDRQLYDIKYRPNTWARD